MNRKDISLSRISVKYGLPVCVFLSAFFVRLLLFFSTNNYFPKWEDIPASKILEAQLPESIELIWYTIFPLYSTLLRGVLALGENYIFIAPAFSFFWGVLSVLLLFFLLENICGKECAFFSAMFLSFFPVHVIQSVLSTEMTFFIAVLLLNFLFFYQYYLKRKSKYLLGLLVLLNSAHLIRPEAWILGNIIVLLVFVLVSCKHGLFALFFGNIMLFYNIWVGKISEYILGQQDNSMHELIAMLNDGKIDSSFFDIGLGIISNLMPIPIFFLGIFGVLLSLREKKYYVFSGSFFSLFILYIYKIKSLTMHPHPRYFSLLVVFLIPFLFLLAEKIIKNFRVRVFVETVFLGFIIVYFLNFNFVLYTEKIPSFLEIFNKPILQPQEVTEVVDWMSENSDFDDSVLIDQPANPRFFLSIAAYLDKKRSKTYILLPESRLEDGNENIFLKNDIIQKKPDFLIIYQDGYFLKLFLNFYELKSLSEARYIKRFSGYNCQIWQKIKK